MKKNLMLFAWFLKFGLIPKDEYSVHDNIRARFCPKFIPAEEFDEKEQLLRDSPGPAGIKYAYYTGSKVGGILGAVSAIAGLFIPVVAIAVAIALAYEPFMNIDALRVNNGGELGDNVVFNSMYASALGLVIAHLYKIIYFNKVRRKAAIFILPAAAVFIGAGGIIEDMGINAFIMPFYIVAVILFGILFGIIHAAAEKYREKHPKFYDPYSKKAVKLRERKLREEEEDMRGYKDDDTIKKRREQLEKEKLEKAAKQRKFRGEE